MSLIGKVSFDSLKHLSNYFDSALRLLPMLPLVIIPRMPSTQMSTLRETIQEKSTVPRLSNSTRTFAIVLTPLRLMSLLTIQMQPQAIVPSTPYLQATNHPVWSNAILEPATPTGLDLFLAMLSPTTPYS